MQKNSSENWVHIFTIDKNTCLFYGIKIVNLRGCPIHGHGIFFMGVGLYYISQNFGRGGQFFWGNFRILLHFYYQIFSENLGGRVG